MYPSLSKGSDLDSRLLFSTMSFDTSTDQTYSLQDNIYDEFARLGYETVYIFDMSCELGSLSYPEGKRGGKKIKNKKSYKKIRIRRKRYKNITKKCKK